MKNVNAKIFWLSIFLGVILRFFLMSLGHNFDFDSYCIVGELASQGKNIYANTARYNYGFVWFTVLGLFWNAASYFAHKILVFRVLIVGTLTLADFFIAQIISKKAGNFWGIIFFLNPISLIITGYHNQFDNIAVLIGAYAVSFISRSADEHNISPSDIAGIALLSLSLITKHILWAFPLWILFSKNIDVRKKLLFAFIPPLMFLLSFIPFWSEGSDGIIMNVFLYKSFNNFPIIALAYLNRLGIYLPFQNSICLPIFAVLMLAAAYIFRNENIIDAFLLYTVALVVFSSAIANQYLAIPCMAVVIIMRRKSAIYFLIGLIFLAFEGNGLHIHAWLQHHYGIGSFRLLGSSAMYSVLSWCLLAYLIYCRLSSKHKI